jgi:hypothetical protein
MPILCFAAARVVACAGRRVVIHVILDKAGIADLARKAISAQTSAPGRPRSTTALVRTSIRFFGCASALSSSLILIVETKGEYLTEQVLNRDSWNAYCQACALRVITHSDGSRPPVPINRDQ